MNNKVAALMSKSLLLLPLLLFLIVDRAVALPAVQYMSVFNAQPGVQRIDISFNNTQLDIYGGVQSGVRPVIYEPSSGNVQIRWMTQYIEDRDTACPYIYNVWAWTTDGEQLAFGFYGDGSYTAEEDIIPIGFNRDGWIVGFEFEEKAAECTHPYLPPVRRVIKSSDVVGPPAPKPAVTALFPRHDDAHFYACNAQRVCPSETIESISTRTFRITGRAHDIVSQVMIRYSNGAVQVWGGDYGSEPETFLLIHGEIITTVNMWWHEETPSCTQALSVATNQGRTFSFDMTSAPNSVMQTFTLNEANPFHSFNDVGADSRSLGCLPRAQIHITPSPPLSTAIEPGCARCSSFDFYHFYDYHICPAFRHDGKCLRGELGRPGMEQWENLQVATLPLTDQDRTAWTWKITRIQTYLDRPVYQIRNARRQILAVLAEPTTWLDAQVQLIPWRILRDVRQSYWTIEAVGFTAEGLKTYALRPAHTRADQYAHVGGWEYDFSTGPLWPHEGSVFTIVQAFA